ncbi:DinB family protein [Gemmata sp. JC717]|uniref:DinB family protein n=1 Tax=Gemmata algarum TaxID=2975278 RepID=UPI0021BB9052|nr:DinB family protein [Gemmata algarum]MDY3556087.1 DinB family protein [Gemmata algarum]
MQRPEPTEYAPFYGTYITLVPEGDVLAAMESQLTETLAFWRAIPESQGDVCHAPYTWTVKQVLGHLIDGERIFGYRALRFARGDSTPLPGFEENDYAKAGSYERLTVAALVSEFEAVRRSSLWLFRNLPAEAWARSGKANDSPVTVRALAYIVVGHVRHHGSILRKRLGAA